MLLIVSAPSGCGKTTMVRALLAREPGLHYSVSYTTRRPRPGEREGTDYHFVAREVFEEMVRSGAFAEWAEVFGNRYGTSARQIDSVLAQGEDIVCDIDVQGAMRLKARYPEAVLVFVLPPSIPELRRRLSARNTDRAEVCEERLAGARAEIAQAAHYDYFVINDDLEQAVERLHHVLLAERLRQGGTVSV